MLDAVEKKVAIFLSHKSDDDLVAKQIAKKLMEFGAGRLDVHVSELIPAGEKWDPKIHEWLKDSDWLLLLYTGPGVEWDWCLYETGFFAGLHGTTTKRLVCLHRDGVELPGPLKAWEAVTEKNCHGLLADIFRSAPDRNVRPINSEMSDETLKTLSEYIMQAVTERPKPTVLTPFIELVLEDHHQKELRNTGTLAADILVTIDVKSREIFGVLESCERALHWSDVVCLLEETRQRNWISSLADSMRRLCRNQIVSTTCPVVYSVVGEYRRRWRPILYSVQFGAPAEVFRIVFSEIRPEDDPRPSDPRLDHCTALMAGCRMLRFGVIDKYRPFVRSQQMKRNAGEAIGPKDFDDKFASLPVAIERIETEALNSGLQTIENVLELFPESQVEQRGKLEASTNEWIGLRARLFNAVATRNLDGLGIELNRMRDVNRDLFRLIAHRYCELVDELT